MRLITSAEFAEQEVGENHVEQENNKEQHPNAQARQIKHEVEESEHLQHLRDVYKVEDDEFEDATEIIVDVEDEDKPTWELPSDQKLMRPHEWHWKMTLGDRWNALFSVLKLYGDINTHLQHSLLGQSKK
ncbi:unnamed protein product [Phytophthora lilii]|uniref:Unnamed protein product n=1 Tax=Phytophthora lilii TaxID=2077276 RepID=A0A9W6XBB5_9STRA|nr:unnamed protein product [Phytophthora lilii]